MPALDRDVLSALAALDTCRVANAIECFDVRLRNEGFTDGTVTCVFDDLPPLVGHAVTARIKSAAPPTTTHSYYDRTDWWDYLGRMSAPWVLVAEDVDEPSGTGAFVGEVHAAIFQALGCVGYVTNGAVRDLPQVRAVRFPLFAGRVAVSHAFVHLIDFGEPVSIGGLTIAPGDLLHGDRHGLLSVPLAVAAQVPETAARLLAHERKITEFCRSPQFSIDRLRTLVHSLQ